MRGRPEGGEVRLPRHVVRVSEMPSGGHFGAYEEPEAYAQELREFFRPYRDR